jgi:AcrR family transcriptional regulator
VTTSAPLPLSRERILQCAVRIADRDGLDAASLRKVAIELGVHVTSLYNHVPTKEALLDGVVDQLFAAADLPLGEVAWEQWVRGFVTAVSGLAYDHPGAFALLLRRPVQGPGALATFEAGLAAFRRAGLDVTESYGAVKTVALAVLGCCLERASAATGEGEVSDLTDLSWQEFPLMHQITSVVEDVDVVELLTEVLVAGLAQRITRR